MNLSKWRSADYSAEVFRRSRDGVRAAMHVFHTCFCRIWLRIQGVHLGKHVSFNGHIHVERFKHSVIEIGDGCTFNSNRLFNMRGIGPCVMQTSTDYARIIIGKHCGFSGVSIVANKEVTIGNHVTVGANVKIGDRDDHPDLFYTQDAPVHIEDDVFIGMNSIILKGVTIGKGSIIGAGSVVTKSIPAGVVAAGVPCKVIRAK